MNTSPKSVIAFGGSAGSLQDLIVYLDAIPPDFQYAVIIILHRMRNVSSDLAAILSSSLKGKKIIEPDDKQALMKQKIYLAPQNYHLLVEEDSFSLDYSEPVMYSRPSIDVSFESIAQVFGSGATGILLSGANNDGAEGLRRMIGAGGKAIVQNPETAAYRIMPQAAIALNPESLVYNPDQIIEYLQN